MYICEVSLSNFRCFGNEKHVIKLKKGLNVLVGENDSGKTAIVDAIRIALGVTDQSWYRIELSDFYKEDNTLKIEITCKFADLSEIEQAAFLECLTYEGTDVFLYINWNCKYLRNFATPRLLTEVTTGKNCDGPSPASEARELLRATYLRPLRDAYMNMQAGRGSRLSQILYGVNGLNDGEKEYADGMDLHSLALTGIADLSNKLLVEHSKIKEVNTNIAETLSNRMLLAGDKIGTEISVSGTNLAETRKLTALLEKLELSANTRDGAGRVGLGTSNVLSMACELQLNKNDVSSFLLIEEPEAHVHAQRQLRLIQSLEEETADGNHQIIITTHSPLLASVVKLDNITIMKGHSAYSLSKDDTCLSENDYSYLERYLDATKANLFFANGVIIVEGPSEELLIPTIAKLLNKDFTKYGVSVVNARGIGLNRFSGIFKRKNEQEHLDIPVACITDRDILPDCAPAICYDEKYVDPQNWPAQRNWKVESDFTSEEIKEYISKICSKADGQTVKTFVSDHWTLEYDLAYSGLNNELLKAIIKTQYISDNQGKKFHEERKIIQKYATLEEKCSRIHSHFSNVSKPEVAQELAIIIERKYAKKPNELRKKLPGYIISAIEHVTKE